MVKAQDFNGNEVFEVDRFAPKPKQTLDYDRFISTPKDLRDEFKKWKGVFTDGRKRDLEKSAAERPSLTRIPTHRLVDIFTRFLEPASSNKLNAPDSEDENPDNSVAAAKSQDLEDGRSDPRRILGHRLRCDNCAQVGHRWMQCLQPCQTCGKIHEGQLNCSPCGLVQLEPKVPGRKAVLEDGSVKRGFSNKSHYLPYCF